MEEQKVESKPKKPFYKKWWFVVIVFILFLIGVSQNSGGDKTSSPASQKVNSTKEAIKEVDPIKVSPEALMRDYEANEVSADSKYKNQIVEVSGLVSTIGKDILDTPYVSFKTNDIIFTVQCMFDKSQSDKLAALSKGQKLTLRGKISGKLGNIIIKECNF